MTLTEVSYYSRRLAPLGILAVIMLFIFYYLVQLLFLYAGTNEKKAPIVLDTTFQKLKPPSVKDLVTGRKFAYSLDTIDGRPTPASEAARVYLIPPTTARFGYKTQLINMARNVGIDTDATDYTLDGVDATFNDGTHKLVIDITNFNYSYELIAKDDPSFFTPGQFPDEGQIQSDARDFLATMRYPEELAQGIMHVIYLNFNTQTKELAVSNNPYEANVVEVDFYRPDIDGYPMVSPKYFNSQNYVIMTYVDNQKRVLKSQVKFFEKSSTQVGIYPLKTGDQAWKDLQDGKAMIINAPESTAITVKKMLVGYLDPDTYQDYLQPVFVFLGDNGFVAYLPAVTNPWLIGE